MGGVSVGRSMKLSRLARGRTKRGYEERVGPGSPWWGEHVSRYEYAAPYVKGRVVLDVACGVGYGLPRLQETAKWVVGADIDPGAVEKARRTLAPGRGEVVVSDATRLPFGEAHFEAITSFETLEHLTQPDEFLREVSRVLAPTGVFLLSTPNANYTRPIDGKPRNPYHVREYRPAELAAELGRHFRVVKLLGQRLNSRFVVPPFESDMRDVADPVIRMNAMIRKVLYRCPSGPRDRMSQILWGHPFFPSESDYSFSSVGVDEASVLLAVCASRAAEDLPQ
jgi:2-polyprenyl-3-methyl-5-hydroxy-6-metoxy-1,4-benzoquinol methylase